MPSRLPLHYIVERDLAILREDAESTKAENKKLADDFEKATLHSREMEAEVERLRHANQTNEQHLKDSYRAYHDDAT